MNIGHDHRKRAVSRTARRALVAPHGCSLPRVRGALGVIGLLSFGCSVSVPERSQSGDRTGIKGAPLLFVTGQSGTRTVTLRAGEADGTTRILAEVELHVSPLSAGFEYDQTGDFFGVAAGLRASPDGSSVLFLHDGSAEVLDIEDGTPAAFSPLTQVASWPVWSPDGSRVAYTQGPAYTQGSNRLLTADRTTGKESVAIDCGDTRLIDAFEWSPDGKHLAYLLNRLDDSGGPAEFHVVTATGTDDRLVHAAARFCGGAFGHHPASVWSADSAHVAFVVSSIPVPAASGEPLSGTVAFQTARADGSGSSTVLELPASDYEPRIVTLPPYSGVGPYAQPTLPTVCEWSPRTNWLAVSGRSLQVLRPDGGERHELDSSIFPPDVAWNAFASLSWAPDGEHLARISQDGDSFLLRTFRPSANNADNAELGAKLIYGGSPCCVSLEWSPDGKHALYLLPHDPTVDDGSTGSVHLWHAERGTDEQLSVGLGGDYVRRFSGFSPEGSRIFYGISASSDSAPRSRPVDGGPIAPLPPDTLGWVSEDVVAVVRDGGIFISNVDGTSEKSIWENTPDDRLLSVRVPRPLTGG